MGIRKVTKRKPGTSGASSAEEIVVYVFELSDGEQDAMTADENNSDESDPENITPVSFILRDRDPILTLPVEILYQIYASTTPRDLLSLCRTCKHFRSTLLTRNASFIWTEVLAATRANLPTRPDCISLPAWVALFFGPPLCSVCGSRSTRFVPFVFLRRFCNRCMQHKFCAQPNFPRFFPKLSAEVLRYVPYCLVDDVTFYLKSDIKNVGHALSQFQQRIDRREPGAGNAMRAFMSAKSAEVADLMQLARVCQQGASSLKRAREQAKLRRQDERRIALAFSAHHRHKQLQQHLLARGWAAGTVDAYLRSQPAVLESLNRSTKPLTSEKLAEITPALEKQLGEIKAAHIKLQALVRMREREPR